MMTISNDTGRRSVNRSMNSFAVEIAPLDAFSNGVGMLLRAMIDEFDAPVATTAANGSVALRASGTTGGKPDLSSPRAFLEAMAARFAPTVVCIKAGTRCAFAV